MKITQVIKKNQMILFPFLDIALNGVNYFFHIYCSWYLLAKDYGSLNSLLSIAAILFVSGISFQIFTAKEVSARQDIFFIGNLLKNVTIFTIITFAIFIILIKFIINLTHSNSLNVLILIAIFIINVYVSVLRGVIQGKKEFIQLNLNFYIEVLSKMMILILLLPNFRNIITVLLSIMIGMSLALMHLIFILHKELIHSKASENILISEITRIFISNFFIYYFTSIDMIIVNYFIQETAGMFAVILRYSQILMFVSFSLFTVFLPSLSEVSSDSKKFIKKASKFLIIFVAVNLLLMIFYYFFAPLTIKLLFGANYLEAGKYLIFGALAYFMLVACFYIVNLNIILKRKNYLYYLALAAFILTLALIAFHKNIQIILITEILVYLTLFLILIFDLKKFYSNREVKKMKKIKEDNIDNIDNKNRNEKKITILFLSWRDIKAPKRGGAEVFTHEMLKRVDKNRYNIIHFSPEYIDKQGIPSALEEDIDGVKYIRKGNPFTVILEARKYYLKNRKNIDFVVDQCNTHRFFSKFWVENKKRIFFIHQLTREIWFMNMKFPFNYLGYLSEIPFLRLSKDDYTITVSQSTKNNLLDAGVKSDKISILPEGLDFLPWKKEKFYEKEKEATFIYVGRYSNYKGIDKTVEAFCQIKKTQKDAKLWIVGKKNEEYINAVIKPILAKYGTDESSITFWGFVSDEKKLELMSRAHALLFPSMREGWGLIITEAGAVGTPSIGYNSPGIRDALDMGKAGYLCENNNVDELLYKMKDIIKNKENYNLMKENAYNFAKNFHWDYTAEAFDKFISEIR